MRAPFKPIEIAAISQGSRCETRLGQLNLYLGDIHTMFLTPVKSHGLDAGCNFHIALGLCSIIGGLSRVLNPKLGDGPAFKQLIRDHLGKYWPGPSQGWLDIGTAAETFYTDLRNPLVHALGTDEPDPRGRQLRCDIIVGKWGEFTPQDISHVEQLSAWPDAVPVLANDPGRNKPKVILSGLYWLVRRAASDLFSDPNFRSIANSGGTGGQQHNVEESLGASTRQIYPGGFDPKVNSGE